MFDDTCFQNKRFQALYMDLEEEEKNMMEIFTRERAGTKLISPIVSPCNGFVIKLSALWKRRRGDGQGITVLLE
jgi:hypothetical protein